MRALVLDHGALTLREVPRPSRAGECLVRVRLAGICGTDLQMLAGYAEFTGIPGHEFVGTVEEVSSAADQPLIGRRVVGEINVGCGACALCRERVKEHCPSRTVVGIRDRDGAFAEYLTLPASNLHVVPDELDDRAAVFVEPTAAACRILEQVNVTGASRVAVLGDGRLGQIVAQVMRSAAGDVLLVGRHAEKLGVAAALGIRTRQESDPGAREDGFDVVVDATGRPEGLRSALSLVRPRGTVVLKSTFHGEAPIESWPIVVREVAVLGSRCGPFAPALRLLASGAVRVDPLVSETFPFEEHERALRAARRALKVLLTP